MTEMKLCPKCSELPCVCDEEESHSVRYLDKTQTFCGLDSASVKVADIPALATCRECRSARTSPVAYGDPGRDVSEDAKHRVTIDRHHWGTKTTDGVDIGSKTKRRNYLKATGYAEMDDYGPGHSERVKAEKEKKLDKSIRETIERKFYTTIWRP